MQEIKWLKIRKSYEDNLCTSEFPVEAHGTKTALVLWGKNELGPHYVQTRSYIRYGQICERYGGLMASVHAGLGLKPCWSGSLC